MTQVSYPKPTIIRSHHAQISHLGDLALGICAPLAYSYFTRIVLIFSLFSVK